MLLKNIIRLSSSYQESSTLAASRQLATPCNVVGEDADHEGSAFDLHVDLSSRFVLQIFFQKLGL